MATQAERTAETRGKVLEAARSLFTSQGYGATTIADLLENAEVSKGALYHHFESKQAIAEAVFAETSQRAILVASQRSSDLADPLDALVDSCLCWLAEAAAPTTSKILFDMGPAALGWERCRSIEASHSLRALRLGIDRAVAAGRFSSAKSTLAAHTINAVLAELAWIAFDAEVVDADERATASVVRATVHALAQLD